jgi:phospholipid/cholesterol/gamma-HCH transport system substrate-binding protein
MITQRSTEIKVGVVSVLAILLFIAGIMLGRGCSVGVNHILTFRFPNSGGVEVGSPVTVDGVKRGSVTSVENSNGEVLVTATVSKVDDLHEDASAVITMLEITGGKKISIDPGVASQQLDPSRVITGRNAADIGDLLEVVDKIGDSADKVIRRADTLVGTINAALADGKIVSDARQSIEKLNELLTSANTLVSNNKAALQETINDVHDLVAQLRRTVDKNAPAVDSIVTKLDVALTNANKTIASVDKIAGNANTLIDEVNGLVQDIKKGNGFVSKVIYDEKFSNRLDSTVNKLKGFLDKIDENGVNVNLRLGTRP